MIGGSYGGAIQLATAAVDHRVDALVPMITWNDLAYALAPNNTTRAGSVPGAFKWQWANGFYLIGESQPLTEVNLDPSRINSLGCLHFVTEACDTVRTLNSGSFPAARTAELLDYSHSVSPVSYLSRVKAPTLLVQGQSDSLFNLNEATATYKKLKAQGTTARMIWQSGGHSGGITDPAAGELNLVQGNLETSYVGRMDPRLVRPVPARAEGRRHGPGLRLLPRLDHRPERHLRHRRPPARAQPEALPLRGRQARRQQQEGDVGQSVVQQPAGSHEPFGEFAVRRPRPPGPGAVRHRGHLRRLDQCPLPRTLDVVGAPKVTLEVSSPKAERTQDSGDAADKLVLFAKIYDIAPDGTKTLAHRLVAPVRVPDVTKPFTVTLPGVVHRYEKGHRLQFVIAASDDAYFGNRGIKPVTVVSAPGRAGVLELPVGGR